MTTTTIKEIAQTIGNDFVEAVKAAELADSYEIASISKTLSEAYQLHLLKLDKIRTERNERLGQISTLQQELERLFQEEHDADIAYQNELVTIEKRLEQYRLVKAEGNVPDRDLATSNGKPIRKFADLGKGNSSNGTGT